MAKKHDNVMVLVGTLLFAFFGSLSWYLLNFDYKVVVPPTSSDRQGMPQPQPVIPPVNAPPPRVMKQLKATIHTEVSNTATLPAIDAVFTLINADRNKAHVVDTLALAPLYELKLQFLAPDGKTEAVHVKALVGLAADSPPYVRERDGLVELLPGREVLRRISLSSEFELKREGKYSLTVTYRPEALMNAEALAGLDVDAAVLTGTTEFEWTPRASEKLPDASGAGIHSTGSGRAPAPLHN